MAYASIKASSKMKDFDPVPAGMHIGICTGVIDVGFQASKTNRDPMQLVFFRFEFPNIRIKIDGNDEPRVLHQRFGLYLSKNSYLRKFLESWRGKAFTKEEEAGFDITSVVKKICQVNVTHSEDGKYANITAAFPLVDLQKEYLTKNPEKTKPYGDVLVYSTVDPDKAVYEKLPEFLRKMIDAKVPDPEAEKVKDVPTGNAPADSDDWNDEIPFD